MHSLKENVACRTSPFGNKKNSNLLCIEIYIEMKLNKSIDWLVKIVSLPN